MNTLPISAADLIGAITKTTTALATDASGKAYLKLHKGGFFVYGADDMETEEESQWAVNPNSFAIGFVAWPIEGTGKPLGEEMRGIMEAPILLGDLPRVQGEWTQQVSMQLMCVSGEDTGTEVIFKTSSKGGINGFNDFLNQVLINLKANVGSDKVVPVIDLVVDSYKHPNYGKIYTPVFTIKSWVGIDAMPTEDEPESEPEPAEEEPEKGNEKEPEQIEDKQEPATTEEKPARRSRKKAEPKAEEKPVRRRRRRAAS